MASSFTTMSTTGKRYMDRTHDRSTRRVLDARTKAVLNEVLTEPRGRAVEAYLRSRALKRSWDQDRSRHLLGPRVRRHRAANVQQDQVAVVGRSRVLRHPVQVQIM